MSNLMGAFPKALEKQENSFNGGTEYQLEQIQEQRNEIELPTDTLNAIKRRILIGIHAYGVHNLSQIQTYVGGLNRKELENLIKNDNDIKAALKDSNLMPCLTRGEITARLSVEAENSPKGADRISALKLLMEYRGLAAPEGGARSFNRMVARFKK